MNAKEILEKIMEYKGLSAPTLASQWGLTAQTLYDMQSGKTKRISPRVRAIIAREMPEINQSWLLSGEGDMFNGKTPSIVQNIEQTNSHGNTITANDNSLVQVVAEQSRQISKLIEMVDRLTHADGDREGSK